MAVLQARTREQIRVAIGRHLGAVYVSTISGRGTGANMKDFNDKTLYGGDDDHNGKYIRLTSGSNDGFDTRVFDYVAGTSQAVSVTTQRVIVRPDATGLNFTAAQTYEMWDEPFPPTDIDDLINQAIVESTGRVYDPEESLALFADGFQTRFDMPSQFSMLQQVEWRSSVQFKSIDTAESAWTAGTNVTVSVDSKIKKQGAGSNKIVLAAGVSSGAVVAYKNITSIDISGYTHVEFWIRCTKATTSAADLKLLLDDTAAAVSPKETLSIPALSGDTWTFVRLALSNPRDDTAIISVGLEDDVDIGAETVWIDDIRAVHNDTGVWKRMPRHLWHIDKQSLDLVFTNAGRSLVGYAPLKLIGGDKPALLTADGTSSEVNDWYIESRATELAFIAAEMFDKAAYWHQFAEEAKRNLPVLVDVRTV